MSGARFSPPPGPKQDASYLVSSTSSSVESNAKVLHCPVPGCSSLFGADGDAVPHRLSCGDVVCAGCWGAAQGTRVCPLCGVTDPTLAFVDEALAIWGKQRLVLSSGAASARVSLLCFDCQKLIDEGEEPAKATHVCGCGDKKPLCDDHVTAHLRKGHTTSALDPLADIADDHCIKHAKQAITLFCVSEKERLCPECVPKHKGHHLVSCQAAIPLLLPELHTARDFLCAGAVSIADSIAIIAKARDELIAAAARSETSAITSFDAVHSAIDARKGEAIGALQGSCVARVKVLDAQLSALRTALSQVQDGVDLAQFSSEARNLNLLVLSLKSLQKLGMIPRRDITLPGETLLSLEVDMSAVLDTLSQCSLLRTASGDPVLTVKTVTALESKTTALLARVSELEREVESRKQEISSLREELVVARAMESVAVSECDRIGTAGKGGVLSRADVDNLIRLANSPVSNANISAALCGAVDNACLNEENRTLLGEPLAAIKAVLAAMEAHPAHASVQSNGCAALWNINVTVANQPISIAAGALASIDRAFAVLADDAQGKYNAIGAVAVLTTAASIEPILDAGWLGRLTFMQEQQADGNHHYACCMALYRMALQPAGKAAVLADTRSVPYLQRARENHPGHALTQKFSKLALDIITEHPAVADCKRIGAAGNGAVLSRADADTLIRLGTEFVSDAVVSAAFCGAVSDACLKDENRTLLGEAAIKAVLAAMDKHPADVSVQSNGCVALCNINLADANKSISIAAGTLARIDRAFAVLAGVAEGKYRAIGAVAVLTTAATIQPVLDAGWLGRILTFMQEQQANGEHQYACCMALYFMAFQPAGKAAVRADALSVPYLQRARDAHPGHANAQQFSKLTLDTLAA